MRIVVALLVDTHVAQPLPAGLRSI